MNFNKISLACLVLSGSALLAACGGSGGSSPAPTVASSDLSAGINLTTGSALVNSVLDKSFEFKDGVLDFGTKSPTSLKLSGDSKAPSFVISSTEGPAAGTMTYGSCIFTVSDSNFASGKPLAKDNSFKVSPCNLIVATIGIKGDNISTPANVTLQLGTFKSNPVSVFVSINAVGVVTLNGFAVGTVTVVAATGTGT